MVFAGNVDPLSLTFDPLHEFFGGSWDTSLVIDACKRRDRGLLDIFEREKFGFSRASIPFFRRDVILEAVSDAILMGQLLRLS